MKMMKKGLALALAVLMLTTAIPFGGLVVLAAEPTVMVEGADADNRLVVNGPEDVPSLLFTPTESGWYTYYSGSQLDVTGEVWDANGNVIASNDDGRDDPGFDYDFLMEVYLTAGQTYTMIAWNLDGSWTGNFPVYVVRADMSQYVALTEGVATTVTIAQSQGKAYFTFTPAKSGYYAYYSMAEDSIDTYAKWMDENGWHGVDQGGQNNNFRIVRELTAGTTYYLQASFFGDEVGSFPVIIEGVTPRVIEAVYFYDVSCMSYNRTEEGHYNGVYPHLNITYSDGTSEEYRTHWIRDDMGEYYVEITYDVPMPEWVEDGVYTATATIADLKMSGTYAVTVQGSPVASVYVPPITWVENYHGWKTRDWYWDAELGQDLPTPEYHYYNTWPNGAVITLKDGTVIEGNEFVWNGQHYSMTTYDDQRYENQWGVGVHTATATIAGYEFSYTIEVIASPVASVEVLDSITLFENCDGEWKSGTYWDDALQTDVEYEYFRYYGISPRLNVIMQDGTVFENTTWIDWNGECWYMNYASQEYDHYLTMGVNTWSANILGYEFTYEIEIIDTMVQSVTVAAPIQVIENYNGFWDYDYICDEFGNKTPVEWFYYYNVNPRDLVITLKDGTVIEDNGFEWNGKWYGLSYDGQSYENRLLLGENERQASIAGYDFTYIVEVVESPVASVVVNPITLVAHQNGYWNSEWRWDEDLQQEVVVEWFYYWDTAPSITVTLTDGTVINGGYFTWGDYEFGMSIDSQWYENRLLPGKNIHTGSIAGYEFEYVINIATISSNDKYEFMETEDGVIITACYEMTDVLVIPSTINGKPVTGIADLGGSDEVLHLVIPDSVVTIGEYVLENLKCLESIHIGASVSGLMDHMFSRMYELSSITISADNAYYCVYNGALYDKAMTTLIAYPVGNGITDYEVPATVVKIGALDYRIYRNLNVTFAEGHVAYKSLDGVIYDKDMTEIISVRKDKIGNYVMPETVEKIAQGAFNGSQLTGVVVSPKVTEIVYCAFANCASLESVTLPEGLISIEMAAFENTTSLKAIELPSTLQYIGTRAFDYSGLTSLTVPGSVEGIGYAAFRNTKIKTLTLNEGIVGIDSYAFAYTPLQALSLPASIDGIGHYAFTSCSDLTTVDLGTGLQYVGEGAFSCTAIESLYIPANVIFVGEQAFAYTPIETLTISEGMEEIDNRAFYDCDNLRAVHLPSTLTVLGVNVFGSCNNLNTLTVSEGKYYFGSGNCVITHGGMLMTGCNGSVLPQDGSVRYIGEYAFYDCDGLKSINLPDGLKSIEPCAFYDCDGLTTVVVPDSVETVGIEAFAQSTNLTQVQLGDNVSYVGSGAFAGTGLSDIDLGDSLTFIAPYLFQNSYLEELFIPSSVTDIMYEAFTGCGELTSIEIPVTVTSIEEWAFDGCYSLTDVYYQGTEADRENMYISYVGNDYLLNATWHYEWISDEWDEIVCEHVYDNACDTTCNLCGDIREVSDHDYSSMTTDPTCGADGLTVYTCGVCGDSYSESIPATGEHSYDNACDADCNVCGGSREVGDHVYDNACDADCNVCGAQRQVGDHVYDNKYDADCNICGAIREVPLQPAFTVLSGNAIIGETVDVWVDVEHNSGIVQAALDIHYDNSVLELLSVKGGVFEDVILTPTGASVLVSWLSVSNVDNFTDGTMACFTFALKDGVAPGSTTVSVSYKTDDVLNAAGEAQEFLTNDRIVSIYANVRGDADGDGHVSTRDLAEMIQNLNGWEIEVVPELLDVDADGQMTNRDYVLINRYYNGWDVELQ